MVTLFFLLFKDFHAKYLQLSLPQYRLNALKFLSEYISFVSSRRKIIPALIFGITRPRRK